MEYFANRVRLDNRLYGEFSSRITIMALLVTLWGIRLTLNFARKGAYSIKFWSGKEDYRWDYLRNNTMLKIAFMGIF